MRIRLHLGGYEVSRDRQREFWAFTPWPWMRRFMPHDCAVHGHRSVFSAHHGFDICEVCGRDVDDA